MNIEKDRKLIIASLKLADKHHEKMELDNAYHIKLLIQDMEKLEGLK